MKTSAFSRALELAALATRVGLKEVRSGNMKSRLEQAALIVRSLSNLKGAAMKAGQLLSLDLDQYFPPEALEILSQLQNSAVAQPFEEMKAILRAELGENGIRELDAITPDPIGVASIGQVHRANYQGREIVLKIQYSGISDSIDSDLTILKTIAGSFCRLTGREMDLNPLFKEFGQILAQEVDYNQEAQILKEYRSLIAGIPDVGFSYRVPEVIDELSTGRILAMSFEQGQSLRSWLTARPSKDLRQALAKAILDLYFHEFFEWGLVQTDPNWGNFLVDDQQSKPNLVLLDFGATRRYSREFIRNYVHLLRLAASGDSSSLIDHAIEFGLIDRRESKAAQVAFAGLLEVAIRPFFSAQSDARHFDFSDERHSLNSNLAAKRLAQELIYSPPPYSLVFLHRKLAGVYSILKSLAVQLDVSDYWKKMLDYSER